MSIVLPLPRRAADMILAMLQRIAAMTDVEEIRAMPVLVTGIARRGEKDVTRYFENAVLPSDGAPLAREARGVAAEPDSEGALHGITRRPPVPNNKAGLR